MIRVVLLRCARRPAKSLLLAALAIIYLVDCSLPESAADAGDFSLKQRRGAIAAEVKQLSATDTDTPPATDEAQKPDRDQRLAQLQGVDAVLAQIQARREERLHLEQQKAELDRFLKSLEKFKLDEPKPYSFLLRDSLRDQLEIERLRAKALAADGKAASKLLSAAHQELDQSKQAEPHPAQSDDADSSAPASSATSQEDLSARQRAQVELRQIEVEINALRVALCEAKQAEITQKLKVIGDEITFSPQDRDTQLGALATSEARLKGQRRQVERELQRIEEEGTTKSESAAAQPSPGAKEEIANLSRATTDACQSQIVLLDQRIDWLGRLRRVWRQRYDVATNKLDATRLSQWLDDLADFREELSDAVRSLENRRDTARTEQGAAGLAIAPHKSAAPANADDPTVKKWHDLRDEQLHALTDLCAASVLDAQAAQRTLERFHEEMTAKLPRTDGWGALGKQAVALFDYNVAGDDDHSVTLGRLLILVLYVTAGVFIAWALSRALRMLVLARFGLHRGRVDAIHSIFFYSLCCLFGVAAFRVLDVPLAAFAFLGGAAAIAIGFGSQDIMNNFMSGIILLAEQPIRVGDVVTLDGVTGVVMHIGLRSTRLQTESNYEVTVPNKSLLDEQVTNFTLSDNMVQVGVVITLDRETKIAEAKQAMLQVVFNHPVVVKSMQPLVLVKEIDNYWLTFEIRFWLQYQNFQQCASVQSQILETLGDMYRPLTDEEKEARAAAKKSDSGDSSKESPEGENASPEPTTASAVDAASAEDESAEPKAVDTVSPGDGPEDGVLNGKPGANGGAINGSAKLLSRKLGRKMVKKL